jgi:hypothetical protein
MNKKQLVVLWVTIVILVALSLFPMQKADGGVGSNRKSRGRVYFLSNKLNFEKKNNSSSWNRCSIDVGILISQTIVILGIGTGLIITLNDKKK